MIESTSGKLDRGRQPDRRPERRSTTLKANQYVRSLVNPLSKQGKSSLAEHQTLGIISVNLTLGSGDLDDDAAKSVFDATAAGQRRRARGLGRRLPRPGQLSSPSTRLSEIVGIVAAMIVLVFVARDGAVDGDADRHRARRRRSPASALIGVLGAR